MGMRGSASILDAWGSSAGPFSLRLFSSSEAELITDWSLLLIEGASFCLSMPAFNLESTGSFDNTVFVKVDCDFGTCRSGKAIVCLLPPPLAFVISARLLSVVVVAVKLGCGMILFFPGEEGKVLVVVLIDFFLRMDLGGLSFLSETMGSKE